VGHGLNKKPDLLIVKNTERAVNWAVYHSDVGATKFLPLNLTNAETAWTGFLNNTEPTSSVITRGNGSGPNHSGEGIIIYAMSAVEGYSAFGSYTGNGSSDGPFVFTGFRPAFLMWKLSSASGGNWNIEDDGRSPTNPVTVSLRANTNEADLTTSQGQIVDLLSNGFKVKNTSGQHNTSGATYVYVAFAENPFKTARAR
jgi:hypothetical protein